MEEIEPTRFGGAFPQSDVVPSGYAPSLEEPAIAYELRYTSAAHDGLGLNFRGGLSMGVEPVRVKTCVRLQCGTELSRWP